jgi:hypothetical protein
MDLLAKFLEVAESRQNLLLGMLEPNQPVSVAAPIRLGIDLAQVAVDSVQELIDTLTRGLGGIEGELERARRERARLPRESASPAVQVPQEAQLLDSVRDLAISSNQASIRILEAKFQLLAGVGSVLIFKAQNSYCKTFAGEAMTGFREKLKEALQEQVIAGIDAALEGTLIPFMARVISLFKGWEPLIRKNLPPATQWHRDIEEYLETAVNYAVVVDSFIEVVAAGGSVRLDEWTSGDWESRIEARLKRVRARGEGV